MTVRAIWCGAELCEARDDQSDTTSEYYPEGTNVRSNPPVALYYGVDQIGSVRRVFDSEGTARAFSY